jgi:uncharacterized membrane protein
MRDVSDAIQRTSATRPDDAVDPGAAWTSPEAPPATDEPPDVVPVAGRPPADPRSFVGPESTPPRGVRQEAVPSVAAIAGHPIHPMLVPLPIGAFSLALASDVAFAASGDRFWARASQVLIGTGIVTGALAGVLGATDFFGRRQVRERGQARAHALGNAAALGLSAASLALRRRDSAAAVVPVGLALSLATGSLLLVTGWLGGELSYRHRIGVTAD